MEERKKTSLDRIINATWTFDLETADWSEPKIDISTLTIEEQADLIIEKLKAPPKPKITLEDRLAGIMSKAIADEIDKEILETLKKGIFR
jgi:hypothetical protein